MSVQPLLQIPGPVVAPRRPAAVMPGAVAQRGVTAIELLVVMVVVGVLAAVAAPSFVDMLRSMRMRAAWGTLVDDVNRTKNEAIKRNARVLLCARDAAGADCVASASLQAGWLVCVEDAANPSHCLASTSLLPNPLVVRPPLDASLTLVKSGASASTAPLRFSADSSGTAAVLTLGGTWAGALSRAITVAATGGISKQ